jgi:transposase
VHARNNTPSGKLKYEMLCRARVDGQPITAAASAFGFSRPSFYQAQSAFDQEGLSGLIPKKPGPRGARKLGEEVMRFVLEALGQDSTVSAVELAQQLEERFGLTVHPRSIERAVARRLAEPKDKHRQHFRSRARGARVDGTRGWAFRHQRPRATVSAHGPRRGLREVPVPLSAHTGRKSPVEPPAKPAGWQGGSRGS